jgi:hypothetical protein
MDRGILARDAASTVDPRRSGPIVLDVRTGNTVGKDHQRLECKIAPGSKSTVECKALTSCFVA